MMRWVYMDGRAIVFFNKLAFSFGEDYLQDDTAFWGVIFHYRFVDAVFLGFGYDRKRSNGI